MLQYSRMLSATTTHLSWIRKSVCAWGTIVGACTGATLDKMSSFLVLISRVNVTMVLLLIPIDDIIHAWLTPRPSRICLICFRRRNYAQISIPDDVRFRWFVWRGVGITSSGSDVSYLIISLTQDISLVISCRNLAFKEFLAFVLELSYLISFAFGRHLNIRRALCNIRRILIGTNIGLALCRLPSNPHFETDRRTLS